MQRSSTPTAYILFSLMFILIAAASFAAFSEAEEICNRAGNCLRPLQNPSNGEMIWEVVSRQFLTLLSI
ncbi:hypothetical protein HRH25_18280 [Flavisolibacter sp. BT320]|nr:hypothetical protein [Flavisolibacter longurius]